MKPVIFVCILAFIINCTVFCVKYEPNWESLDKRPIPAWYDDAKIGIFITWGIYSVPSTHSEWFWWYWKGQPQPDIVNFMKNFYPPDFTYADFASEFKAEFYNPYQWRDIIVASGAKYIVFTTKHCEGFSLYPSNYSFNWNSQAVGPKRDLVGPLKAALSGTGVHLGLYHALLEWFHPLFLEDKKNNFTTNKFAVTKSIPEMYELTKAYKPDLFWADGGYLTNDIIYSPYWKAAEFVAWLYNESPVKDTVVTNDRWGFDTNCKHGGYWTCSDRYNPGKLQNHKWENAMSIDRVSWGYRRDAPLSAFLSIEELLQDVISTISYGGNILMNIAPTAWGTIAPIYEERLRQLGSWLKVNGEGIYSTTYWKHQNDTVTPAVWYTASKADKSTIYCLFMKWPINNQLVLGAVNVESISDVTLLGSSETFYWIQEGSGSKILFPVININEMPCLWAWTLKITLK